MFEKLFKEGLDFVSFFKNIEDKSKELIENIMQTLKEDKESLEKINSIAKECNILVFAEDWCPDCIINIPPLYFAEQINSNIKLRIVTREGNEKQMEIYKVNGKPRVPTIVILDELFNEKGHIIETPKRVKDKFAKGNEQEVLITKRKYKKGQYSKFVIEDMINIIEKA